MGRRGGRKVEVVGMDGVVRGITRRWESIGFRQEDDCFDQDFKSKAFCIK